MDGAVLLGQRNYFKALEYEGVAMCVGEVGTALLMLSRISQPNLGCWFQPQMISAVSMDAGLCAARG